MPAELRASPMRAVEGDGITVIAIWAALLLSAAAALAQVLNYAIFNLGVRALNSNTHVSIFGGLSLLATALGAAAAVALALRSRELERVTLSGLLVAVLALRISYPPHVLVVSLPFTATALVILWRKDSASRSPLLRIGCSLLVLSFAIHALDSYLWTGFTDSWAFQVQSVLMHETELAGWILIAAGLLAERRLVRVRPRTDQPSALRSA